MSDPLVSSRLPLRPRIGFSSGGVGADTYPTQRWFSPKDNQNLNVR